MNSEIAISGVKPCWFTELPHGLQTEKRVALYSPPAFATEQAGENVGNRIYVRRDVESPPEQVDS